MEIENLGPISWALKTSILRDKKNGIVKISQEAYITDLLQKHNVTLTKPQYVPSHDNLFLPVPSNDQDLKVDEGNKKKYQSILGALW